MSKRRVVAIVAQASVLFALSVLFIATVLRKIPNESIDVAITYLFPNAVGGWWVYRGVRSFYPRTEAIVSGIAFAVCSPLAMAGGLIIALLTSDGMALAILTGTLAMMLILSLIASLVLLFIFRRRYSAR